MAPEPIPMPNQNQVGFMNAQKASPTQQMDGKYKLSKSEIQEWRQRQGFFTKSTQTL